MKRLTNLVIILFSALSWSQNMPELCFDQTLEENWKKFAGENLEKLSDPDSLNGLVSEYQYNLKRIMKDFKYLNIDMVKMSDHFLYLSDMMVENQCKISLETMMSFKGYLDTTRINIADYKTEIDFFFDLVSYIHKEIKSYCENKEESLDGLKDKKRMKELSEIIAIRKKLVELDDIMIPLTIEAIEEWSESLDVKIDVLNNSYLSLIRKRSSITSDNICPETKH